MDRSPRGWCTGCPVQCHPRPSRTPAEQTPPPRPLWLAWIGGPLPADLRAVWRWYLRRFTVDMLFDFSNRRWAGPLSARATQRSRSLDLAGRRRVLATVVGSAMLAEVRLPWEHPRGDRLTTPGQVQRHFSRLLVRVGTPARAPRPRGKAPGRLLGQRPYPPTHYEVARRGRSRAA